MFASLSVLGISVETAMHIYYFFMFFLCGASTYYLASVLFPTFKSKRFIALFAAVLYMFNPYLTLAPFYSVLPLVFALYVKGLREGKIKYALYLTIAFFAIVMVFPTYSTILLALGLLAFYTIFYWISQKAISGIKFIGTTLLLLFVANLWWLLPTYSSLIPYEKGVSGQISLDLFTSANAQLPQVFRWMGQWSFYSSYKGLFYAPWLQPYINNPLLVLITFAFPILAFCSLLFKPKDKFVLFFSALLVLVLFFSKGINPPLGNFYLWFINISIFAAFRDPSHFMYLITLGYSILIAVTCGSIVEKMQSQTNSHGHLKVLSRRVKTCIFVSIFLILILVSSFYIVDGEFFVNWWNPQSRGVTIPQYYSQANKWFSEQSGDFRILMLPAHWQYVDYTWGYFGTDSTSSLISRPLITGSNPYIYPQYSEEIINYVYTLFSNLSVSYNVTTANSLGKILGLLNVKYLVVDTSINPEFYGLPPISNTTNTLNRLEWATLEEEFGNLLVYENTYFTPHVYATQNPVLINGSLDAMTQTIANESDLSKSALFLSEQNDLAKIVKVSQASSENISVTYNEINPTEYDVHVYNASEPFLLVLSESYDPNWIALVNGQQVSDQYHFVANGYANAWYLSENGTFQVVLSFEPQRLFYNSLIISLATFSAFTVSILVLERKKLLKSQDNEPSQ